jgi:hypothetical protein
MQWFFQFLAAANEQAGERTTCPAHSLLSQRRLPCEASASQCKHDRQRPEESFDIYAIGQYMDFHEVRAARAGTRMTLSSPPQASEDLCYTTC